MSEGGQEVVETRGKSATPLDVVFCGMSVNTLQPFLSTITC